MLQPFKAWQVHGLCTDGRIFTESLGCLVCLYSWVGEPCTLQADFPPACPCVTHCMSPVPLHSTCHGTQQGVPTCLSTRTQSWKGANRSYATVSYYVCEPTSCYGNHLLDPVWRLWEHYLSGPFRAVGKLLPLVTYTPGWGSRTASIYPIGPEKELSSNVLQNPLTIINYLSGVMHLEWY